MVPHLIFLFVAAAAKLVTASNEPSADALALAQARGSDASANGLAAAETAGDGEESAIAEANANSEGGIPEPPCETPIPVPEPECPEPAPVPKPLCPKGQEKVCDTLCNRTCADYYSPKKTCPKIVCVTTSCMCAPRLGYYYLETSTNEMKCVLAKDCPKPHKGC